MGLGTITAHALTSLEARGILFVKPGMEVVMIVFGSVLDAPSGIRFWNEIEQFSFCSTSKSRSFV